MRNFLKYFGLAVVVSAALVAQPSLPPAAAQKTPRASNMTLVGYNDLQARSAYQPVIEKQGNRWIAYVGHHGGEAMHPIAGKMDPQAPPTAPKGKWTAHLRNLSYGGPDTLTVSGVTTLEFTNVLVGEVWVCSGQSNMELALRNSFEPAADIAASANPSLRLFTVQKLKSNSPTNNVRGSWSTAAPANTPGVPPAAPPSGRALPQRPGAPPGVGSPT